MVHLEGDNPHFWAVSKPVHGPVQEPDLVPRASVTKSERKLRSSIAPLGQPAIVYIPGITNVWHPVQVG